ncbi:hypothetical protein QE152_g41214, partial [Popillia japonica]
SSLAVPLNGIITIGPRGFALYPSLAFADGVPFRIAPVAVRFLSGQLAHLRVLPALPAAATAVVGAHFVVVDVGVVGVGGAGGLARVVQLGSHRT